GVVAGGGVVIDGDLVAGDALAHDAGLDEPVDDEAGHEAQHDRGGDVEEPVRHRVHGGELVAGQRVHHGGGDAREQGVQRSGEDVGGVARPGGGESAQQA